MKCTFCGSENIRMETPYVELDSKGEYVKKTTWCCAAQAKNQKYIKGRYEPGQEPDDVSKW